MSALRVLSSAGDTTYLWDRALVEVHDAEAEAAAREGREPRDFEALRAARAQHPTEHDASPDGLSYEASHRRRIAGMQPARDARARNDS